MLDPATLAAAMAAAALGNEHVKNAAMNIGCGIINNWLSPGQKRLTDTVIGWLGTRKTPQNHDVLKITHAAYVAAMGQMAGAATALAFTDEERDAAKALTALVANRDFADFRWDGEHLPLDACQACIETLFAGRLMPGSDDDGWSTYNRRIVTDLAIWAVDLPPRLAALFIDGHEPHPPWHLAFRHAFAEQLKADEKHPEGERAFRILTFERLNELTANGAVLVDGVAGLHAKIDNLQTDMRSVLDGQQKIGTMIDKILDHSGGGTPTTIEYYSEQSTLSSPYTRFPVSPFAAEMNIFLDMKQLVDFVPYWKTVDDSEIDKIKATFVKLQISEYDIGLGSQISSSIDILDARHMHDCHILSWLCHIKASMCLEKGDWRGAQLAWEKAERILHSVDSRFAEALSAHIIERLFAFCQKKRIPEIMKVVEDRLMCADERVKIADLPSIGLYYNYCRGVCLRVRSARLW